MDIKQITEEAEKLMIEDMQSAINADEQWRAEMYLNWAIGTQTFWRRLITTALSHESDISRWDEIAKYRDNAEEKLVMLPTY